MALHVVRQMAFDEKLVEDTALESALEERERRKSSLSAVRAEFKAAHQAATVEIEKLDLGDGTAVRVGRFRISRSKVAARTVGFDAAETTRVQISLLDGE